MNISNRSFSAVQDELYNGESLPTAVPHSDNAQHVINLKHKRE